MFGSAEYLQVLAGSRNDVFNLSGQTLGISASSLSGNRGNDTFNVSVSKSSGYSQVVLAGGLGTDSLTVTDENPAEQSRKSYRRQPLAWAPC